MDAVVTWIDTTDNRVISPVDTHDNTRIGSRNSLKYCLRGLYYNLPWLDNIYLVTNEQWPNWLDIEKCLNIKPKIIRVDHKIINPNNKSMYGCPAIEICLDRIPNLSEAFLYANDDTFVVQPMGLDEWIKDAKIIFRYVTNSNIDYSKQTTGYNYYDVYYQYLLAQQLYPSFKEFIKPLHQIVTLSKKSYSIAKEKLPNLYEKTYSMIGRPDTDRLSRFLIEYIAVNENLCLLQNEHSVNISQYIDSKDLSSIKIQKNTKLLCINHIWDLADSIDKLLQNIFSQPIPSEII
jgi:hypothetical protein